MIASSVDKYIIIQPNQETQYMLCRLMHSDRYSYYNLFLLDNDQDKWMFQRQVKCGYLHRTINRTFYTLCWAVYYNVLPDTIEKSTYLRILKFIQKKLKDGAIDETSYLQYDKGNKIKTNIGEWQ